MDTVAVLHPSGIDRNSEGNLQPESDWIRNGGGRLVGSPCILWDGRSRRVRSLCHRFVGGNVLEGAHLARIHCVRLNRVRSSTCRCSRRIGRVVHAVRYYPLRRNRLLLINRLIASDNPGERPEDLACSRRELESRSSLDSYYADSFSAFWLDSSGSTFTFIGPAISDLKRFSLPFPYLLSINRLIASNRDVAR